MCGKITISNLVKMSITVKVVSSFLIRGLTSRYANLKVCYCITHDKTTNKSYSTSSSSKEHTRTDGESDITKKSAGEGEPATLGSPKDYFSLSESFEKSDEWTSKLLASMLVYPKFVTLEEELHILKEIEPYISRLHYESSHWDDAIHNYRETERAKWNQKNTKVIDRVRSLCFPPSVPQLRFVHILDLEKTGVIKPHIDSVRFCGNTIAGISLLSDSIMRLRHDIQKQFYCDVLLPRLSLYVMKDFSRYEFTHEILGEKESTFKGEIIPRDRRISIICRNEPESDASQGPVFKPLDP